MVWRSSAGVETLPKAGSNRQYVRMFRADGSSVIGVMGPSVHENRCFVYLASHFYAQGLPMPRIYAFSGVEDLLHFRKTRVTHHSTMHSPRHANRTMNTEEEEKELLTRTIRRLAHVQVTGAEGLHFLTVAWNRLTFDVQSGNVRPQLLQIYFSRPYGFTLDEGKLEDDFQRFAADLVGNTAEEHFFLYRDFQARNVMLDPTGEPHFIDFQGGMKGPLQYDVASFLWQASARYPQTLREALIRRIHRRVAHVASRICGRAFPSPPRTVCAFPTFSRCSELTDCGGTWSARSTSSTAFSRHPKPAPHVARRSCTRLSLSERNASPTDGAAAV